MKKNRIIVLSDCLNVKHDEGCIRLSNMLVKKMINRFDNIEVISYNNKNTEYKNIKINKMFLSKKLFKYINRFENASLIYIPFSSNTFFSIIRILILSLFTNAKLYSIFVMRYELNKIAKKLLKFSKTNIICFSNESFSYYKNIIDEKKVLYLKAGVDTNQFVPVNSSIKQQLRNKYGFLPNDKIILHVGHLHSGRNINEFLKISDNYKVILVISSITSQDIELKEKLSEKSNIFIFDDYYKNIQELYQIADVYLFPVIKKHNCIDVPLSVMEACSCNIKILTTKYGELKEFNEHEGFHFIKENDFDNINELLNNVFNEKKCNTREMVLDYDWNNSIEKLKYIMERTNEK